MTLTAYLLAHNGVEVVAEASSVGPSSEESEVSEVPFFVIVSQVSPSPTVANRVQSCVESNPGVPAKRRSERRRSKAKGGCWYSRSILKGVGGGGGGAVGGGSLLNNVPGWLIRRSCARHEGPPTMARLAYLLSCNEVVAVETWVEA